MGHNESISKRETHSSECLQEETSSFFKSSSGCFSFSMIFSVLAIFHVLQWTFLNFPPFSVFLADNNQLCQHQLLKMLSFFHWMVLAPFVSFFLDFNFWIFADLLSRGLTPRLPFPSRLGFFPNYSYFSLVFIFSFFLGF